MTNAEYKFDEESAEKQFEFWRQAYKAAKADDPMFTYGFKENLRRGAYWQYEKGLKEIQKRDEKIAELEKMLGFAVGGDWNKIPILNEKIQQLESELNRHKDLLRVQCNRTSDLIDIASKLNTFSHHRADCRLEETGVYVCTCGLDEARYALKRLEKL